MHEKNPPQRGRVDLSLSPVRRGEGRGEGPARGVAGVPRTNSRSRKYFASRPLTLTLSPGYRGEGTMRRPRPIFLAFSSSGLDNVLYISESPIHQEAPDDFAPQPACRFRAF